MFKKDNLILFISPLSLLFLLSTDRAILNINYIYLFPLTYVLLFNFYYKVS